MTLRRMKLDEHPLDLDRRRGPDGVGERLGVAEELPVRCHDGQEERVEAPLSERRAAEPLVVEGVHGDRSVVGHQRLSSVISLPPARPPLPRGAREELDARAEAPGLDDLEGRLGLARMDAAPALGRHGREEDARDVPTGGVVDARVLAAAPGTEEHSLVGAAGMLPDAQARLGVGRAFEGPPGLEVERRGRAPSPSPR